MITLKHWICHKLDWKKDLAESITEPLELLKHLKLSVEQMGNGRACNLFKLRVPLPYVNRMEAGNPSDPLLRQVWPVDDEYLEHPEYVADPLKEKQQNPAPGLLHKYGQRALTISTASCAINCRYCFRRHFPYSQQQYGESAFEGWVDYLASKPNINELILSGGEPLLLSDRLLEKLDQLVTEKTNVKRIRIHTRMPLVIPNRITSELCNLFERSVNRYVLVWHINHPNEIDNQVVTAAKKLQNAGVLQLNQSVYLNAVNDSVDILCALSERLFDCNIQPYYLHQLDKVAGTRHFDSNPTDLKEIYQQLLARLPGFLVPRLVCEEPYAESKTPIFTAF